jgi:hypothetical protein
MSFYALGLQQSLKGLPFLGNYSGFPLQPTEWSKYIVTEQILSFSVYGLKPGTVHRAFLNGVDVTSLCKQQGKPVGAGLQTPAITDNSSAGLQFVYYFRAGSSAVTAVEQAAAFSILVGGARTLEIKSADGTSTATVQLGIPQYARNEVESIIKKSPSTNPNIIAQTVSYVEVAKTVTDTNFFFTPPNFSLVQTFYADPEIVAGASEVTLTSVDLFFNQKPSQTSNLSGNPNPGVAIAICEVENDQPNLQKTYAYSLSYKDFSQIYSFGDASSATTFGFKQPLKLPTGRFYGIVVMYEDPGFAVWINKVGDRLVNTNIPSPGGNSNKDGKLFIRNSAGVFNSLSDSDIKFNLRCAKFIVQSDKKIFTNKNYEYLTVTNQVGSFYGGEYVWQNTAPETGSVSITQGGNTIIGLGTTFSPLTEKRNIVLQSGNASQVVTISEIVNNTVMSVSELIEFSNTNARFINTVVGKVYIQDRPRNKIYLKDSTANTIYFATGNTFIGADSGATANIVSVDNITIDRVRLRGSIRSPANGLVDTTLKLTAKTGTSTYTYSETNSERVKINNQQAYNITGYNAYVLSRSNEIQETSLYSNTDLFVDKKSLKIEADYLVLGSGDIYMSPLLEGSKLDLFSIENRVSNACNITTSGVNIDTEVAGNGVALSKHIGTKVQFSNDKFAEDIRMFMVAYRPKGTEIRVYARVHNSKDPEAFDDKSWTPLEYIQNTNKFSSIDDETDFVEYELGLPAYSESSNTLPGTFTTTLGSASITAANTEFTNITGYVANNDVIKIYNPLFPLTNYQVAVVEKANTSHIIIGGVVETTNIAGPGYKIDKLKYPNIAFNNINNSNISRYYNTSLAEIDAFDSMQVKIVMLADNTFKVPKIDQVQVLGVSA